MANLSDNIQLQYIGQNEDIQETILNDNYLTIDSLIYQICEDLNVDSLPINPLNGNVYILSNNTSSELQNYKQNICIYNENKGWIFIQPKTGMKFYSKAQDKYFRFYPNKNWLEVDLPQISDSTLASLKDRSQQTGTQDISTISNIATIAKTGNYNDLLNIPTIPKKMSDLINDSFSNINNTSDANKPVSNATKIALDLKANSNDVLYKTNNLIEVSNTAIALQNLGGLNASANLSDLTNKAIALQNLNAVSNTLTINGWTLQGNIILTTENIPESITPTNKYFTGLRAISSVLIGFVASSSRTVILATDTILGAFNKVQKYFNDLSVVAFSGNYNDLTNKPNISASQVNSDWNATTGIAQILNKPILSSSATTDTTTTANISDSTNKRYCTDAQKIVISNTSNINTGDETTATIQTKRPLKTINSQSLEGSGNLQINYTDLSNKPTIPTIPTNISSFTNDSGYLTSANISNPLPILYKSGLAISNNTTSPNTKLDIATGKCRSIQDNYDLILSSSQTLDITQTTDRGGALTNGAWYRIFLISNGTTTKAWMNIETDTVMANLPSGYTFYRRIGAIQYISSSSGVRPFFMSLNGTQFRYNTVITDYSSVNATNTDLVVVFTYPKNISIAGIIYAQVYNSTGGAYPFLYIRGKPAGGYQSCIYGGNAGWGIEGEKDVDIFGKNATIYITEGGYAARTTTIYNAGFRDYFVD